MTKPIHLIGALGLLLATNAKAEEPFCARLRQFEEAKPDGNDKQSVRRWVEFHWGSDPSPDSQWSWSCRSASGASSKQMCTWLMKNTNQEFEKMLPINIMQCHGYGFPKFASYDWGVETGKIKLHGVPGKSEYLELKFSGLKSGERAIRLVVEDDDADNLTDLPDIVSWAGDVSPAK